MELIGLRECGRRLGVSDTAVRKAIAAERVTIEGRTESGRPLVGWPLAREQWQANTDASMRKVATPAALREAGEAPPAPPPRAPDPAPAPAPVAPAPPAEEDEDELELEEEAGAAPPQTAPVSAAAGSAQPSTYAQARAAREMYQARLARLEYEQKIGKLVSADEVKAEAFAAARRTRDAMLNISSRIANQLAAERDPAKISARLDDEIRRALRELVGA